MEKLKMTKEGLESQYEKLSKLEHEAQELDKAMTKSCQNSSGDGPHDNAEFEDLLRQANMKAREIRTLRQEIGNVEVIENLFLGEDFINIDDIVDANFIFGPEDEEEMTVQLVGGIGNSLKNQISVNSPLGKAIYGKKIGDNVSYIVNQNKIEVNLLRKVKVKGRSK